MTSGERMARMAERRDHDRWPSAASADHSDHSVALQVSWATDQFLSDLLDQSGRYYDA